MIRFTLNCSRDHAFEGWFKDGATFERQAEARGITCPICGDDAIRKAVMAPAVARSTAREPAPGEAAARRAALIAALRQVRAHVEQNFENVGERFAEEARRIHYGEAETRDIFGQATLAEAKELHEEGIPVRPLPEPPKLDG